MAETVSTSSVEHYSWGDGCSGWHLVRTPELSVIEERMPRGASERRHRHHTARQFFYVLSGTLVIECEGVVHALAERNGLEIAPGVPHQVRNEGPVAVQFLVVSQPPSHGDRYEEPVARG